MRVAHNFHNMMVDSIAHNT